MKDAKHRIWIYRDKATDAKWSGCDTCGWCGRKYPGYAGSPTDEMQRESVRHLELTGGIDRLRVSSLRRRISAWLDPAAHRDAHRLAKIREQLIEARWWLGVSHPDVAAHADLVLRQDAYLWDEPQIIAERWSPPSHVWGIGPFRDWLDGRPFAGKEKS